MDRKQKAVQMRRHVALPTQARLRRAEVLCRQEPGGANPKGEMIVNTVSFSSKASVKRIRILHNMQELPGRPAKMESEINGNPRRTIKDDNGAPERDYKDTKWQGIHGNRQQTANRRRYSGDWIERSLEAVLFEEQVTREITDAQTEARIDAKNEKMKYLIGGMITGAALVQIIYITTIAILKLLG